MQAVRRRVSGSHALNADSSRSHLVVTLLLDVVEPGSASCPAQQLDSKPRACMHAIQPRCCESVSQHGEALPEYRCSGGHMWALHR